MEEPVAVECPNCVEEFDIERALLLAGEVRRCPVCGEECGLDDIASIE